MNANALLWVYHDTNALTQTQFIQKFLLILKWGFRNAWNQNIFKLNLLFLKSHLPFDLRLPKNWWSLLENSWIYLKSDDLAQKTYFHNLVKQRDGGTFPRPFSGKMNSLKIKHLKKIHFLVPEYGNLIGVKTHRDKLNKLGKKTLG